MTAHSGERVSIGSSVPTAQKRLIGLLEYIEQVEKMNRTPPFDVPTNVYCAYEETVRSLPNVELDLSATDAWLRIPRLKETDAPAPSAALKPWLVLSKSPDVEPTLRDDIAGPKTADGTPGKQINRREVPQVEKLFEHYWKGPWAGWAIAERPRRVTIATYNKLFSLHQALEAEGTNTPLELVWGIGVAVWRHSSGRVVRFPLITQLTEIGLDSETLALEVRPRDRLPTLEMDAYAALNVSGVVHLEATWKSFLENTDVVLSPFDGKSLEGLLKPAAGFLDSTGIYWPDVSAGTPSRAVPMAAPHLVVTDTWVIFARPRSPNYLIDDLQRLRKHLEHLNKIPEGPAALVTELPDEVIDSPRIHFRGRSFNSQSPAPGEPVSELYFPKPYNDEQVSIVEKLEHSPGVVVQGPPGTGKTHTIANVICHYLAKGRRVLVTSKGEPALAVLREQIPESIQALTVALLTDERDGMRQFEHAIQSIAAKVARIQPDELDRQIRQLEQRLNGLHSQIAATDQDIAAWARKHLHSVEFHGRRLMPVELAKLVVSKESECGWMPDILDGDFVPPLFSDQDIQELRGARRELGSDLCYLESELPDSAELCEPSKIGAVHEALCRARVLEEKLAEQNAMPLISTEPHILESANELNRELTVTMALYDQVYSKSIKGTESLQRQFEGTVVEPLQNLENVVQEAIEMERGRQCFVVKPVDVPADSDIDLEFREAVDRLAHGKSAVGLFAFAKKELKGRLASTLVSGLPPQTTDDWAHVRASLDFRKMVRAFVARWNAAAAEVQLPRVESVDPESFRKAKALADHVSQVRRLAVEQREKIVGLAEVVFGPIGARLEVTIARSLMVELQSSLDDQMTRLRHLGAKSVVEAHISLLHNRRGPVVSRLQSFIVAELGQEDVETELAAKRWTVLLAELRRIESLQPVLQQVRQITTLIEQAGGKIWAHKLRTEPVLGSSDDLLPPTWLEAWQWRQAATFVDAIDGRKALGELQGQRKSAESDLAHTYQGLVEQKTWREVHRNSPPAVKAALQAYLSAVSSIGKGTGKRAIRHRRAARTAMLDAYRAVPCWIMPHWRVSETLPPEIGKFDLVIVDEASQSDLWVLPALLRGVKVLVVGDDKQVSPEGIGLSEERIKDLQNRFLSDQAHGDQMTPEKSMYDLAKVVFAGEMVMLREHFRCVPAIIEFSKREFYNHEIQPLRLPKASERLDPPLIDVFVRGGVRADKVNGAEARAIVDQIKAIIADPICMGRSLGVVSLLGMEQAHHIFELIREEIPAEEIFSRKLTVGDARTFQGKERDIMLLSMVSTPERSKTVTARMYEQRFNVAASRARDRMYLFRSVELADLSKTDLKAQLIGHFRAPFHQEPLRIKALRDLCESDFERDMYDDIVRQGYRVTPQVSVGSYRIDLVVEGTEDRRLAVECDGDKYHGPEQWSHDMARQRVLERAGWTFWRCFGSSFNRNRQGILEELFGTLVGMGIAPVGEAAIDLGTYCEHRTVDPLGIGNNNIDPVVLLEEGGTTTPENSAANGSKPSDRQEVVPTPSVSKPNNAVDQYPNARQSVRARPVTSALPAQAAIALETVGGEYSDEALMEFVNRHSMQTEDFRSKKGALWVRGNASPDISRQLKTWGFAFTPKRGWWKK